MNEAVGSMELYEKLNRAASLDFSVTPHLMELLDYRKRVAEELLQNLNSERAQYLQDLYNYINDQIKLVLAL